MRTNSSGSVVREALAQFDESDGISEELMVRIIISQNLLKKRVQRAVD